MGLKNALVYGFTIAVHTTFLTNLYLFSICSLVKRIQPDSEIIQDVIENPSPQESQVLENTAIFASLALFPNEMHFEHLSFFHVVEDRLQKLELAALAYGLLAFCSVSPL